MGNHAFKVYVEDRGKPGSGMDHFWIEVIDKDGLAIPVISMDRDAVDNTIALQGGNMVVPNHGR